MNWIKKMFGLCVHEWEIVGKGNILRNIDKAPIGAWFVQRCTKCGELQQTKMFL